MAETANNHIMLAPPLICQAKESLRCPEALFSNQGNTDSIVIGFHSWIFLQSEETGGANSKLFKEDVDDAMYKNPYEI